MFSRMFIVGLMLAVAMGKLLAALPEHDFSDKTVSELLSLLDSNDPTNRHCAATYLGARYRNPIIPATNWPASRLSPELPIPPKVIPALSARLKADDAWKVRMSAIGALGSLRFRTNTTPLLVPALDDSDSRIRLIACMVIVELSREYAEPLHPQVVPTLIQFLDRKGEIGEIGQAAETTERLGTNGTACIPALRTLLTHDSPKVRLQAERALSKIEANAKRAE